MRGTYLAAWSTLATLALAIGVGATWRAPVVAADDAPPVSASSPGLAHPRHPIRLTLEPRTEGARLALAVHLERSALYADLPAHLEIRLPPGVSLVRGETDVTLPAGPTQIHRVLLDAEGVPAEDIVATVEIHGEGRTARGEARHRFGREAPRLVEPPRLPAVPVRGGGSLGTRIRVSPVPR